MASITIREVDKTSPGMSATNTDIAYVPGYAISGPVNTPTLCESIEDFKSIFGNVPYTFKTKQAFPTSFATNARPKSGLMYEDGDYEKSYVYACELLNLGLPVLYERVLPTQIIDNEEVDTQDLTGKLYFTATKGMLTSEQVYGTHLIEVNPTNTIKDNEVESISDIQKLPITRGSLKIANKDSENPIEVIDNGEGQLIKDGDSTKTFGTVDYKTGEIVIAANTFNNNDMLTITYDLPNVYETGDGTLIYEANASDEEDNVEPIVLAISAKTVGVSATDTLVNFKYVQMNDDSEGYYEITITPSADLYGEISPEVIRFTNSKDNVNMLLPEPIRFYKDITSRYVDFEWLQELVHITESSTPDSINVLGNTWSDFGALDTNPNYKLGSYSLPIGAGKKWYSTLQSNYKSITVNMSKEEFAEHADEYADYPIVMQARRPDNGWTTPILKPTDGRLSSANPEIVSVSREDMVFNAENAGVYGESMNFLWCGGTMGAPLSDSIFTGLTTDGGDSVGQEFGIEFKFNHPTYVENLDLFASHGLVQSERNNIAVFIKTEEQPNYSNQYIEESVKYSLSLLNGHLGVAHGDFINTYNKALGYDPKVRTNFILEKEDVNKKFTLQIQEKVIGIRIVGLYKMTIQGGLQHQFYINGVNMYSEHTSVNETSKLLINPKFTHDENGNPIDEFNVQAFYDALSISTFYNLEGRLTDKGEYQIKYLTSGAYPTFEYAGNVIVNNMLNCASTRGECTAYIDHTNNTKRTTMPKDSNSVYQSAVNYFRDKSAVGIYGAMFTPWYRCACGTVGQTLEMPASFAYLTALAQSIKTNPNFLAVAGVTRGGVPNFVSLCQNITNAMADNYQPRNDVSINAITNIKPYGNVIWGNRTLKNNAISGNLTAQSFLNIRNLTNDIKKLVYMAAKRLTFEQNSDILWINFKSLLTPTLDLMKTGNGISGYKIIKKATTEKAKIVALIKIYPIEPVEDWDITIELSDAEVVVE